MPKYESSRYGATHFDSFVVGAGRQKAAIRGEGHAADGARVRFQHSGLALTAGQGMKNMTESNLKSGLILPPLNGSDASQGMGLGRRDQGAARSGAGGNSSHDLGQGIDKMELKPAGRG